MLTFFAQDATSAALVYANADLLKASHGKEVIAFCDHWKRVWGADPSLVVSTPSSPRMPHWPSFMPGAPVCC